jgi:hypothetical protein
VVEQLSLTADAWRCKGPIWSPATGSRDSARPVNAFPVACLGWPGAKDAQPVQSSMAESRPCGPSTRWLDEGDIDLRLGGRPRRHWFCRSRGAGPGFLHRSEALRRPGCWFLEPLGAQIVTGAALQVLADPAGPGGATGAASGSPDACLGGLAAMGSERALKKSWSPAGPPSPNPAALSRMSRGYLAQWWIPPVSDALGGSPGGQAEGGWSSGADQETVKTVSHPV